MPSSDDDHADDDVAPGSDESGGGGVAAEAENDAGWRPETEAERLEREKKEHEREVKRLAEYDLIEAIGDDQDGEAMYDLDLVQETELLELRPKQVLHSGETISVFSPLCVGQEVTVTTSLRELYEQQVGGNPMGFATIDVVGTEAGKKKNVVFEAQRVIAIRGGFPRR